MQILIIGGTGFIGPHLVDHLIRDGHRITVFHRGQSRVRLPKQVDRILGDRDELAQHRKQFEQLRPDVVVDMIAFTKHHGRVFMQTFQGIASRVVVASSIDVYRAFGRFHRTEPGPPDRIPLSEEAELRSELSRQRIPRPRRSAGRADPSHCIVCAPPRSARAVGESSRS
ncbi:MAG: NAD-dependent epimerase/dehydratase family protein [bacterium]